MYRPDDVMKLLKSDVTMSEIITQQSERVTRFLSTIDQMTEALDELSKNHAPRFGDEHYVTDVELREAYKSATAPPKWRSSGNLTTSNSRKRAKSSIENRIFKSSSKSTTYSRGNRCKSYRHRFILIRGSLKLHH